MFNNKPLHNKFNGRNQILKEKYRESRQTGVSARALGITQFQFHYFKFLDTDEFTDIGTEILKDSIGASIINHLFGDNLWNEYLHARKMYF